MLGRQVQELIAKGSIDCISKDKYQNSSFQLAENFNSESFSPNQTMVGLIVDSGYERMSSTCSVHSA